MRWPIQSMSWKRNRAEDSMCNSRSAFASVPSSSWSRRICFVVRRWESAHVKSLWWSSSFVLVSSPWHEQLLFLVNDHLLLKSTRDFMTRSTTVRDVLLDRKNGHDQITVMYPLQDLNIWNFVNNDLLAYNEDTHIDFHDLLLEQRFGHVPADHWKHISFHQLQHLRHSIIIDVIVRQRVELRDPDRLRFRGVDWRASAGKNCHRLLLVSSPQSQPSSDGTHPIKRASLDVHQGLHSLSSWWSPPQSRTG